MGDFGLFRACLQSLNFEELPGIASQLDMAPVHRHSDIKSRGFGRSPVPSAVMLLLYPSKENKPATVFIQRPEYNGAHSGQISFPGGRYEPDDTDLKQTALRETYEEIGVLPESVKILGKITDLFIPPSNFVVSPYIGLLDKRPDFFIDTDEVSHLIEVELEKFFKSASTQMTKIRLSEGSEIHTPCFMVDGHTIWGATAMMLSEFLTMLKASQ